MARDAQVGVAYLLPSITTLPLDQDVFRMSRAEDGHSRHRSHDSFRGESSRISTFSQVLTPRP